MTIIDWVVVLSTSGTVACVAFLICQAIIRAREVHRAAQGEVILTETTSGLMRALLPTARSLGMGLRMIFTRGKKTGAYFLLHQQISRTLFAAGTPQGINADEYIGFGIVWGLMAGFLGMVLHVFLEMESMFGMDIAFIAWCGVAMYWWRIWLTRRMFERQNSIRKQLPFALDILTLSMEAGLDFTTALGRMVKKMGRTPLGQEFSLMLHEIQLGKTRVDALRDFSRRVDVGEVRSVVASLIQAEELGASLGPILRIMAAQQRERRGQRAEEQAMKAPVKMLLPLTLFIFPTPLIMIFTPMALRFM